MKKIQYYYTSMSKQVFLILVALLLVARFVIITEVMIYNINGYADNFNYTATIVLYIIYFVVCAFFFIGYKLFYVMYDETQAVYHNIILSKKKSVDLTAVNKAVLSKKGCYLYYPEEEKHCFFIPFWRLGFVSPVGVDGFYKMLKEKNVLIEKNFKVLPGMGKTGKLIAAIYTGLALLILGSLTQAVALASAIIKSH